MMLQSKWKKEQYVNAMLFCSIFVGLFFIPRFLNNDTWFILKGGQYVFANGIPHTEPFTIHTGLHFVMQQWLTGVIFWKLYQLFGAHGILACVYLMATVILYLYYRLCMLVSKNNRFISSGLAMISGVFLCLFFMQSRPQIFSSFFLLLEVYCLEYYHLTNEKKVLAILPILSILMINMHAAMWGMMICVLLPYLCATFPWRQLQAKNIPWSKEKIQQSKSLFFMLFLILLAGMINPYGTEAMGYVCRSYGVPIINHVVQEMQPLVITDFSGKLFFLLLASVWTVYIQKGISVQHVLLCLGITYLALSAMRSWMLFLLLATFPVASCFQDIQISWKNTAISRGRKLFRCIMGISVFLLGCYLVEQLLYNPAGSRDGEALSRKVVDVLLSVDDAQNIRLWNEYADGAYAEFRGIRCYIDPRAEIFLEANNKKKDIFTEYVTTREGFVDYHSVFAQYDFNYIMVNSGNVLYTYLLQDPEYMLIYEDGDERGNFRVFKKLDEKVSCQP